MRTPILNIWKSFEHKLIGPHISELQRREMKRCFFAGAVAFQEVNMNITKMSDTDGVQMLEDTYQELIKFGKDIRDGKE